MDELEFILPVRLVLEEVAFLRLQKHKDLQVLGKLEGRIEAIREAADRGSVSDVNEADQSFHEMVMTECSGSSQAIRLWRLVMPRVRMLFNMLTPMHESLNAVAKEHEILLEAVRSGSRILLQSELEKHITSQPLAFLRDWSNAHPEGHGL
ncbi:FCD domain-containing protein [Pseudactinotalea sp. Z1748]|uniref:FCD domain-containing protein n=1 Tax=Pseudactinotalea sp. Z1748 TaxID=3413027 RepID=UPI003C7D2B26